MENMVAVAELAEELPSLNVVYRNPYMRNDGPVEGGETYGWNWISGHYATSPGEPEDGIVLIQQAVRGDYNNSAVYTRSNLESLQRDYPETFLVIGHGSHDGQSLALPLAGKIPEDLADILRGLEDYPVYDESDVSGLEAEIENEAWDAWVQWDLTCELENYWERTPQLGCSWEIAEYHWKEMDQRGTFYAALSFTETYPEFENSESCHYDLSNVVGEVAIKILSHRESELRASFV